MVLSVPPLFLGAVLLFWGWQAGQPLVGALFALALEASRVTSGRWALSAKDFNRVTDLSTLALVGALIYLVNQSRSLASLGVLLIWMPAFFMPLLLAQRYSVRGRVPLTSLFLSLRGLQGRTTGPDSGDVDLQPPFFGLCLVCAGAGAAQPAWFLPGVLALFAWLLWRQRSRRFHPALWLGLVVLAAGIGMAGNQGARALRHEMQDLFFQWYREQRRSLDDPYRSYTGIGQIGELKLSERILFRVRAPETIPRPLLLRDAAYNTYSKGIWFAEDAELTPVPPGPGENSWTLGPPPDGPRLSLEISSELNRKGEGLIPHPAGTYRIEELPVLDFWRNGLGAIKVGDGPPLVTYRLRYSPGLSLGSAPGPLDRLVPRALNDTLETVARRIGLGGQPPREAVRRVEAFFARGFGYSLIQEAPDTDAHPLERFLLETRTGHCEYYASATVMLLRKAGVPARYATGYAVTEYSGLERAYLVRRRHAHSWALAYVDGGWRPVDTTPPIWPGEEAKRTPLLQPLSDLYSWLRHRFLRWRWSPEDETGQAGPPFYVWLLAPLSGLLVWRLLRGKRRRKGKGPRGPVPRVSAPGQDSPFFDVVRQVEGAGWPRHPGEPLRGWLARAAASPQFPWAADELFALAALHNRYRFDPAGDAAALRGLLQRRAAAWLQSQRAREGPERQVRAGDSP
ncbi:MAG: transglutaminase-like domain-containing protein [Chromatiales bacterium]